MNWANKSIKELETKLDWLFSRFIRRRDANEAGFVKCFTCPKVLHWLQMTCGHYRKRRHLATRWAELNCEPQCSECNGEDDEIKFGILLDQKHGPGTCDALIELSHITTKPTKEELIEKIEFYDRIESSHLL